jgi:hypothetical protein
MLKRVLAALTVSWVFTCLLSTAAFAAGNPGRTPLPSPPDVSGPFCPGSDAIVLAHLSVNREYIKSFTEKNGTIRLEINGYAESTVTANGKTLAFNSSGPATIWIRPDNTVTSFSYGHVFAIGPYGPNTGILVITGRTSVDLVNGVITGFTGHVTNVCALLLS